MRSTIEAQGDRDWRKIIILFIVCIVLCCFDTDDLLHLSCIRINENVSLCYDEKQENDDDDDDNWF